jgi:hypothetical protein
MVPLPIITYDGSGEAVHPDIAEAVPDGTSAWLMLTPYPGGNSSFENPSIFKGNGDAVNWTEPAGVTNPVATPPVAGYLSDPDLVYDSESRKFSLYYRSVVDGANRVELRQSADGVRWSAERLVAAAPSHRIVSPSVVAGSPAAPWVMWAVNAGSDGCTALRTTVERRTSRDGVHWSDPVTVQLDQPGVNPWHIDVEWIAERHEYWAVYNTYTRGANCATNALYLATSPDGVHWQTYPSPIVRAGAIAALADVVYRSTFEFHADDQTVTLWISGARYDRGVGYHWGVATVTRRAADLLADASTPAPALRAPRRALPPPEDVAAP